MDTPNRTLHSLSFATHSSPHVEQSSSLFKGRQEIVIRHEGQDYRLRITSQNKLILTK